MHTMSNTPLKTSKFNARVNPSELARFSRDSEDGPAVCFARSTDGVLLILVEGRRVLLRDSLAVQTQADVITLRYTRAEWDAFIQGVRAGEFDVYTSGPHSDLIPMRDSKDPEGPILVFTAVQMKPFFDAIHSGKYDLLPTLKSPDTC